MAEDLAEQEARELQQALALSLEEFQTSQGQSPQQQPSGRRESSDPEPSQVKEPPKPPAPGSGGGRRRRKPQPFAPSDAEVDACFRELVSGSRDRIRIDDLVEVRAGRRAPIYFSNFHEQPSRLLLFPSDRHEAGSGHRRPEGRRHAGVLG